MGGSQEVILFGDWNMLTKVGEKKSVRVSTAGRVASSSVKASNIQRIGIAKTKKSKTAKTKKGGKTVAVIRVPNNNEVVRSIKGLHTEILHSFKMSLKKGIALGEILTKTKKELGHNNWLPWVDKYLPFCSRSATNYRALYSYRKNLKSAKVSDLHSAYKLISEAKNYHRSITREETKKRRRSFADKKSDFKNSKSKKYDGRIIAGDNYKVMKRMLCDGMAGKYSGVVTSPPYNADFHYSDSFDDNKPYDDFLKETLKPFPLYTQLLRKGGRVIYIIGSVTKKKNRNDNGDYNHQIITDLLMGVKKVAPKLRLLNHIIWDKSGKKNPLNNKYGSFCSPKIPLTRCCFENILIWSNEEFELENIEKTKPDITEKEFKEWSWNVWKVAPYSKPGNPHPCSFNPKLIKRILKFYTYKNDLILDPYAGVSTTGVVCKNLGRRYTGIDLNANYCDYGSDLFQSA